MSRIDRLTVISHLNKYVSFFNLADTRIFLKYEHSLQVATLCEEIAKSHNMDKNDIDLAWLCGLLHDIGRFEQLRLWKTFSDSESCNHALLGLAVLEGEEGIAGQSLLSLDGRIEYFTVDAEWIAIIKSAVSLHSALSLPDDLDAQTRNFCEIVRDADKIDIIRVFGQSSIEDVLGLTVAEFTTSLISDAAMKGFRAQRCLGPNERVEKLDSLVGVACLSFELVNTEARETLTRLEYLDAFLERPFGLEPLFQCADTQEKWNELKQICVNI